MYLKPLSASLLTFALAFAAARAPANPLDIAGSTTVQKTIVEPVSARALAAVGLELKMLGVGTGKGMQMLFEGKVTVAAVADDLADAVEAARRAGATTVPENLKMVTILIDQIVPVVYPDNPVPELSKDQLKAILSGRITNWKDVGGSDQPILVVVGTPGSATRGVIEKQVLGGIGLFSPTAKEVRTTYAELSEVARDKGAIGCVGRASAQAAKGWVREVKAPSISRPIGFVTIGKPSTDVQKLYDFLKTPEAKKLFVE
jgi:phosphate transport system substrate-binding protein